MISVLLNVLKCFYGPGYDLSGWNFPVHWNKNVYSTSIVWSRLEVWIRSVWLLVSTSTSLLAFHVHFSSIPERRAQKSPTIPWLCPHLSVSSVFASCIWKLYFRYKDLKLLHLFWRRSIHHYTISFFICISLSLLFLKLIKPLHYFVHCLQGIFLHPYFLKIALSRYKSHTTKPMHLSYEHSVFLCNFLMLCNYLYNLTLELFASSPQKIHPFTLMYSSFYIWHEISVGNITDESYLFLSNLTTFHETISINVIIDMVRFRYVLDRFSSGTELTW